MDTAGNQRQWKGEERSLPSVQEHREAKRLVTLAVLQKGLRVGSYSNGRSHAQLYSRYMVVAIIVLHFDCSNMRIFGNVRSLVKGKRIRVASGVLL